MQAGFDRLFSSVMMVCAVVITGSVVFRSLAPARPANIPQTSLPDYIDFWRDAVRIGTPVVGDTTDTVIIVELMDLECPACRGFHALLREVLPDQPDDVAVLYVPHPLTCHRFAMPAARAAACAATLGALPSWLDVIYDGQDSLGLKSWGSYALDAGIADTTYIATCAIRDSTHMAISAGLDLGARIELSGTPTIIVNGWRYRGTPSKEALTAAIERARADASQ